MAKQKVGILQLNNIYNIYNKNSYPINSEKFYCATYYAKIFS